jgi:HK97 family phage prohead protease
MRSPYRAAAAATAPLPATLSVDRAAAGPSAPDGVALTLLRGHATTYEQPYVMYDFFGPYTEVVSAGAGSVTLNRADLNTVFLLNHRSVPMAKTTIETLQLEENDHGLRSDAYIDTRLGPEADLAARVERQLIDEMSFAFMIVRGSWSPDWDEYRIYEYDIHRGDTSAVTFGANPTTDIGVGEDGGGARGGSLSPEQRAAARRVIAAPLVRS